MNRSKNPIRARLQAKGNLFAFNRFISAVLIGACLLTWSVPSYALRLSQEEAKPRASALRTTEVQESEGSGLTQLLTALRRAAGILMPEQFSQVAAGLEETVMAPTLVTGVTAAGVQVARRNLGTLIGQGNWQPALGTDEAVLTLPAGAGQLVQTADEKMLRPGLAVLREHQQTPAVQAVYARLQHQGVTDIPVGFYEDHASLLDWRPNGVPAGQIRVDVTVSEELYDEKYDPGRAVLGAFLLHHAAARSAGASEREAYHHSIAFYESLHDNEREALHAVLNTPWIDHGNTLLTFLQIATDSEAAEVDLTDPAVRGIDSMQLEDRVDAETDAEIEGRLRQVIHHRDRLVSWLLGQTRIDLPYDRAKLRKAATDPELSLDQRRAAAYQVVSRYDKEVERANAARVSRYVRNSVPNGYPPHVMAVGRLSRAYGVQGDLFGYSSLVPKTKQVVDAVSNLDLLVRGRGLLQNLREVAREEPLLQSDLLALADRIEAALVHLQPSMSRLRLLVLGPAWVDSMSQYRGAIRQLRELISIFSTQMGGAIRSQWQEAVNDAREGVSRRASAGKIERIRHRVRAFEEPFLKFSGENGWIETQIRVLESQLAQAETAAAAFSVQLQRPSRTGSLNLFEANELIPAVEKEPALQKLARLAGHNTYASPDMEWVAHATDLIEGAPLSIYERVIEVEEGKYVTVVEVDQEGLEETIRLMADYWARNIEATMDSEHVALARETVVKANPRLRSQAEQLQSAQGLSAEDATLSVVRKSDQEVQTRVARVAAWLAREFNRNVEDVESHVETQWGRKNFITRVDAVRTVVIGEGQAASGADFKRVVRKSGNARRSLQSETNRLSSLVTERRREPPAFHQLTTEAPGLIEGFTQAVLEEEMALRNVILGEKGKEGENLQKAVETRMAEYEERLVAIGEQVAREFGYDVVIDSLERQIRPQIERDHTELDEVERQRLARNSAVQQVMGGNLTLQEELVRIAVMAEVEQAEVQVADEPYTFDAQHPDHARVDAVLTGPSSSEWETQARQRVWEQNRLDADFQARVQVLQEEGNSEPVAITQAIQESEGLTQEFESTRRQLARAEAFRQLSDEHPDWNLEARQNSWYRDHTALTQTTARREVIAAHGLHQAMMSPRYYYGSGTVMQAEDGTFQVTGRRKRYHLIYAPSRVNLAKGERESVEVLPQWVGVTDPLAAAHAFRVYSLINEWVEVRTIKEAENLKTSENERTALRSAIANTQAWFSESLGVGDEEDLSYQFNLRGGWVGATAAEGASFQSGPTTGYCIPKDPLFKLLRHALRDPAKLNQIGISAHLHAGLRGMLSTLEAQRSQFQSEGEFENWMAQNLLSSENLNAVFGSGDGELVQAALSQYISVTGGTLIFHLPKLRQILADVGRPSLLLNHGHDLGLFLWSAWAGDKVTLGGEQVNRGTAMQITTDIFKLRDQAASLNPDAAIAEEGELRVHLYGPYKGDVDHPSPADVRDSAAGRVFMDLSDMGDVVAHALDEKGQAIWRANRYGLRLDSDNPEDIRVTRLLAEAYLDLTETDIRGSEWYQEQWAQLHAQVNDPGEFQRQEAGLLNQGFVQEVRRLQAIEDPGVATVHEQFPGHGTVRSITVTLVHGVSTDDFLGFKVDAKTALIEVADEVQALLGFHGLSSDQMTANAQLERPLDRWVPLADNLSDEQMAALKAEVGGKIHPLAFRLRGPGTDFRQDLQGQDVVVFFTVHPDLLALNPAELRDLMLTGNPTSVLGVRDGSVQRRHRSWFDLDIMLWYAAGRGVDGEGQIITDWNQRNSQGRQAVYTAFGVGAQSWKPLLGTNLREEVVRREQRAMRIFDALQQVADADEQNLAVAVAAAQKVYADELPQSQMMTETHLALKYQLAIQTKGMGKQRDDIIRQRLEEVALGLRMENFTDAHWLSIGGMFLLNGAPQADQDRVLGVLRQAQSRLGQFAQAQAVPAATAGLEEPPAGVVQQLIVPQMPLSKIQQTERKGKMFSVKASEQQTARAVARRTALQTEAALQATLALREEGFNQARENPVPDEKGAAQESLRQITVGVREGMPADEMHRKMGEVTGRAVTAMHQLNDELFADDAQQREKIARIINSSVTRRGLSDKGEAAFSGSYEDFGIIARWFEKAGDEKRAQVAEVVGLFTAVQAIEKTAHFAAIPSEQVDERAFWRSLAEFFAVTIDDHFYMYNPWAYDARRGAGFRDFYDEVGALKPERAEELYTLAWNNSRFLYDYLRELIVLKSPLRDLSEPERDLLVGRVTLGDQPANDTLTVQGIGAGAPTDIERLWRAYGALREVVFLRNGQFAVPEIFDNFDPNDEAVLDARHRVNFTFMAPVGRPHYSKALMEASTIGENLFYTRDGKMVTPPGASGPVLQIEDAHFWLSEEQYREALIRFKGMGGSAGGEADQQIEQDKQNGRMTPKGILVAAKFNAPVNVGSTIAFHHHHLTGALSEAGYPYTVLSEPVYEWSYDKSLYPAAFNPAYRTGVMLPPEIDWLQAESDAAGDEATALARIEDRVGPFGLEHGIIVAKGAAESGSRNFKRFDLLDGEGNKVGELMLRQAAEFIHGVSKGQNVTIQKAIITTPLAWMSAAATEDFVKRQISDWGVPVQLNRHPKSWVYGTQRVITSAGMPKSLEETDEGLFNPDNWRPAHRISLNSLQIATNVGRQGTLEMLTADMLRPELQGTFIRELDEAARRVMVATAREMKNYWERVYVPAYVEKHGHPPKEFDASGVPYWWPRYLMLDFLAEAVWGRNGEEVRNPRVVDVIPGDSEKGTENRFILETPGGEQFEGEVIGFRFWQLEPNVGFGLWRNYWLREEFHEKQRAKELGVPPDYTNVGVADRIILEGWIDAGQALLESKFGADHFGPDGPNRKPVASQTPVETETEEQPLTPFERGLIFVRGTGVTAIGPAQASLVLAEAALNALGGRQTLVGQAAENILDQADEWLRQPERVQEFPQGLGISVTGEQVGAWLNDDVYRGRLVELVLDRVLSEALAPPVQILPDPLDAEQVAALLPHETTFAVVTGKRTLMNHQLYPWSVGQGSAPVNVIGVQEEWLTPDGRAERFMVLDRQTGQFLECACGRPISLTYAFVTELPSDNEMARHQVLDDRLTSGGVQLLNPATRSNVRVDDKGWLRRNPPANVTLPVSRVIPMGTSAVALPDLLSEIIEQSPHGVVAQPLVGTTEGEGVEWFALETLRPDGNAADVLEEKASDQAILISAQRGNVTYQGRPVVLRFNAVAGRVNSVSAVVGPTVGGKIASLGGEEPGEVLPLGLVLRNLQGPNEVPVEVNAEVWGGLVADAEATAWATDLDVVGIDLVLEAETDGTHLQGIILEANARPGTLIFGERIQFLEGLGIQSHPTSPVGPTFWNRLGQGETQPTLAQWRAALQDPKQALTVLAPHYPEEMLNDKREQLLLWIDRLGALRTPAGQPAFSPDQPTVVPRTPGRGLLMGRHLDYVGNQAGSIGFPTRDEIVTFTQVGDDMDGEVEVYVVDPPGDVTTDYPNDAKGPRRFNLSHHWVTPDLNSDGTPAAPIADINGWDDWTAVVERERREDRNTDHPEQAKMNFADDLTASAVAFLRTKFGDPSGRVRNFLDRLRKEKKGLRIAVAGDLAVGGGLSASSALTESVIQTLDFLAGSDLGVEGMINAGFAERGYTGVRAGTKDHSHMMTPPAFRGVVPTRPMRDENGEPIEMKLPPGVNLLLINSRVDRDNAPQLSKKMSQPGNDEQNIKWRSGIGYALGVLWIRKHHPELDERLLPGRYAASPQGLLRELLPGSPNGLTLPEFYRLLREIPAEGLTRQQLRDALPEFHEDLNTLFAGPEPPQPYPVREMVLFGLAEEARNWEVVRISGQPTEGTSPDAVTSSLLQVVETAHDGDRVVQFEITGSLDDDQLQIEEKPWNWRVSDEDLDSLIEGAQAGAPEAALWRQPGWMERSIEPLDLLVDLIKFFDRQHGGGVAAAMVSGAGLGGTVTAIVVRPEYLEGLLAFLKKHYYEGFLGMELDEVPYEVAQPGKAASILSIPASVLAQSAAQGAATAGLEEGSNVVLFEQKALLPPAVTAVPGVGLIGGPRPSGLALTIALSRVVTPDGPLAATFLVETAKQAAGLEELGFSSGSIFRVYSLEYPTLAAAIDGANSWLAIWGVTNVVQLGTTGPVAQNVQQILKNLFDVELTPESLAVWESFIQRVRAVLARWV